MNLFEGSAIRGNENKTLSMTIVGHTRMRTIHQVQNKQLKKGRAVLVMVNTLKAMMDMMNLAKSIIS